MHTLWRIANAAGVTLALLAVTPADACTIRLPEPPLPGESDDAYRVRTEALAREQEARWLKDRQKNNLLQADWVFVARHVYWFPPSAPYKPKYRNGVPLPIPPVKFEYPAPIHFKPLTWLKGPEYSKIFKVTKDNTNCGPMALGDTTFSQEGDLFVFFARKGRISDETLIDAIAVNKINDPALIEFVAPYLTDNELSTAG
jgi:hypothetical protein